MNKPFLLRAGAMAYLLLCLLAAFSLWQQRERLPSRIDSDLFALLPHDERAPQAEAALARLSQQAERQLVILIGHGEPANAIQAAEIYARHLQALPLQTQAQSLNLASLREVYRPYRQGLLSARDRERLAQQSPQAAFEQAMGQALSPFASAGLAWKDDPFGHYGNWLQELAAGTRVRPMNGQLMVEERGKHYVVLLRTLTESAFSLDLQARLIPTLEQAATAAHAAEPDCEILRAGVVLHAAAASQTAQNEISLIGLGSTIGILLLVFLIWRGWQAPLLVALSMGTGILLASALAFACFERVHTLTLVFGSTLLGVAVDYSLHALAHSLDDPTPPLQRYRLLFPGMLFALLTTLLGYLGLALTPFPGLMQMACFAVSGIVASWLVVILWYPLLAPASLHSSWLAKQYLFSPRNWEPRRPLLLTLGALLLGLSLAGCLRLRIHDDIRALAGINPTLLADQIAVNRILGLPSPAQMFIVSGPDAETVLQREEALVEKLAPLVQGGQLSGVDAISRWLPSQARQSSNRQQVIGLDPVRLLLSKELGVDLSSGRNDSSVLNLSAWLEAPAAEAARHLWLGQGKDGQYGSIVLLKGLNDTATVALLAQLGNETVQWVDKPAEISRLFGRYRELLSAVLLGAYVVTALLLYARYRRQAWRILLPTLLASALTLALSALVGVPLQLLNLVALLLILGMGVDYGIFLQEHPQDRRGRLGISLAACTTLLSFGLLAFSSTPALRSFGLTMLFGIGLVWSLALVFRRKGKS